MPSFPLERAALYTSLPPWIWNAFPSRRRTSFSSSQQVMDLPTGQAPWGPLFILLDRNGFGLRQDVCSANILVRRIRAESGIHHTSLPPWIWNALPSRRRTSFSSSQQVMNTWPEVMR